MDYDLDWLRQRLGEIVAPYEARREITGIYKRAKVGNTIKEFIRETREREKKVRNPYGPSWGVLVKFATALGTNVKDMLFPSTQSPRESDDYDRAMVADAIFKVTKNLPGWDEHRADLTTKYVILALTHWKALGDVMPPGTSRRQLPKELQDIIKTTFPSSSSHSRW